MNKRWVIKDVSNDLVSKLSGELGVEHLTALLMAGRGIDTKEKGEKFLSPSLKDLHDPFLLKDMDKAVSRLMSAIESGEQIALYGDYDVDGTTATSLLHIFFKSIEVETACYIPERLTEGYGLNVEALKSIKQNGAAIVITSDCGITNHEELAAAKEIGLDVIVTDHHELSGGVPVGAFAVLNPKRDDCGYPFDGLAGVGVAFNLIMALRSKLREDGYFEIIDEPNLKGLLDIVAIGTVADMVPLIDTNRIFTYYGLIELKKKNRVGLKALMDKAGITDDRIDSTAIGFKIGPRINAAGRLGKALDALSLIVSEDEEEAKIMAVAIENENTERRTIEVKIVNEALDKVDAEVDRGFSKKDMGIIVGSRDWHRGVIGIVASRLTDRYRKPAAVYAFASDGFYTGSVRSVKDFNVLAAVRAGSEFLEKFGGHNAAAGFTVKEENLEKFKRAFIDYLNKNLTEKDLYPEIKLDAIVTMNDITEKFVVELERLAPFGMKNPQPLFGMKDAVIDNTQVVGQNHLRLETSQKGTNMGGIAFGKGDLHPLRGTTHDVAFYPYMDEWKGNKKVKFIVKDISK